MSSDTQPAMTYPTNEQYERWTEEAEELDMSVSEFMQAMIEAGLKKFDARVEPDESVAELREQRNDLKEELDHARERIAALEQQLYQTDIGAAARYMDKNPDAGYSEVVDHVKKTAPKRVTRFLEERESNGISAEASITEAVEETVDETRVSMTDQARESVVSYLADQANKNESNDDESR